MNIPRSRIALAGLTAGLLLTALGSMDGSLSMTAAALPAYCTRLPSLPSCRKAAASSANAQPVASGQESGFMNMLPDAVRNIFQQPAPQTSATLCGNKPAQPQCPNGSRAMLMCNVNTRKWTARCSQPLPEELCGDGICRSGEARWICMLPTRPQPGFVLPPNSCNPVCEADCGDRDVTPDTPPADACRCPRGQIWRINRCVAVPAGGNCTSVYRPVCGCDGVTYPNTCTAQQSGLKEFTEGACAGETAACGNAICNAELGESFRTCPRDCRAPEACPRPMCPQLRPLPGQVCQTVASAIGSDGCPGCPRQECVPATEGTCGNGTCNREAGENPDTCPQDCRPVECPLIPCAMPAPRPGFVCHTIPGPVGANGCPGCPQQECVPATESKCGNGTCNREAGENPDTCPQDCRQHVCQPPVCPQLIPRPGYTCHSLAPDVDANGCPLCPRQECVPLTSVPPAHPGTPEGQACLLHGVTPAISDDGRFVVWIGARDSVRKDTNGNYVAYPLYVSDVRTRTTKFLTDGCYSATISGDGSVAVCQTYGNTVKLVNVASGQVRTLSLPANAAESTTSTLVAHISNDGKLLTYDPNIIIETDTGETFTHAVPPTTPFTHTFIPLSESLFVIRMNYAAGGRGYVMGRVPMSNDGQYWISGGSRDGVYLQKMYYDEKLVAHNVGNAIQIAPAGANSNNRILISNDGNTVQYGTDIYTNATSGSPRRIGIVGCNIITARLSGDGRTVADVCPDDAALGSGLGSGLGHVTVFPVAGGASTIVSTESDPAQCGSYDPYSNR